MTPSPTESLPFRNSGLPLETRVNDLVSRLVPEEKINQMCQYQDAIPRLGIAAYKHGTEAAHGIAWLGTATVFPQPAGLACTWNPGLMRQVGTVIGTEARGFYARNPAVNGLTLWAPTIDLQRDPRWGRVDEAWGEDPVLAGKLAASLIRGIQGDNPRFLRAVASPKHFLGNNHEADRGSCSVSLDPRNLHEYYLRSFEIAFRQGGAQSMMTSYNAINGIPANLNPDIIRLVKQAWGMDGFVVSDAGDVLGTVREHGHCRTFTEAVALSIKAGIDSITDDHAVCKAAIKDALATGLLAESDLDRALRNTFRVRMRLGEFDTPEDNPWAAIGPDCIASPEHAAVAAEAARQSVVLVRNEAIGDGPLLPLSPISTGSLAVLGPLADEVFRDWYSGSLPYAVTPLAGIRTVFGAADIRFDDAMDRIRLRSTSRKAWVNEESGSTGPGGAPCLAATAGEADQAQVFARHDWGWGSSTLRRATGGKWLSTDDRRLACGADEIFGWFTKEVFHLEQEPGASGRCTLSTWNDAPVTVDPASGQLVVGDSLAPENQGPVGIAAAMRSASAGRKETFELEIVDDGIARAVQAARNADTAIVVLGNHPLVNGKETLDRPDICLPGPQMRLARAVLEANPRTILVIIGSYPLSPTGLADRIPAILYLSHAGQETGNALAQVLGGLCNPAGRLAMTWYRSVDQLPPLLDYDVMRGKRTYRWFDGDVLWPFGHGLSYTSFEWSDLEITMPDGDSSVHPAGAGGLAGQPRVSFAIRNSGQLAGEEVAQLYLQAVDPEIPMPRRQLAAFDRIRLAPGESRRLEFTLDAADLRHWDVRSQEFRISAGRWRVLAGASSADIRLEGELVMAGQAASPRAADVPCPATSWDDCSSTEIGAGPEGFQTARCKGEGNRLEYRGFSADHALAAFEVLVGPAAGRIDIRLGGPEGLRLGTLEVPAGRPGETWRVLSAGLETVLPASGPERGGQTICLLACGIELAWFRFHG